MGHFMASDKRVNESSSKLTIMWLGCFNRWSATGRCTNRWFPSHFACGREKQVSRSSKCLIQASVSFKQVSRSSKCLVQASVSSEQVSCSSKCLVDFLYGKTPLKFHATLVTLFLVRFAPVLLA